MKITLKSSVSVPKKPTISLRGIVEKLNSMVGKNMDFFFVNDDGFITFQSNSNVDTHTKLICVVGLYLGSLYNKYSCFLSLGNFGVGRIGRFYVGTLPLNEFEDFLHGLGDVKQVTFSVDN